MSAQRDDTTARKSSNTSSSNDLFAAKSPLLVERIISRVLNGTRIAEQCGDRRTSSPADRQPFLGRAHSIERVSTQRSRNSLTAE
jgi:hypothetical protein